MRSRDTNSKSIGNCDQCGQNYCLECTDAKDWQRYCSMDCEEEDQESSPRKPKKAKKGAAR